MNAIVRDGYGPPQRTLELAEIELPTIGDDDVLVRVHATSVNPADWHILRGDPRIARLVFGVRKPKHLVLGCDVAGVVERVGGKVTTFRPGDEVYGESDLDGGFGAFAEYTSMPESLLAPKPSNLSFAQAAAVPLAAMTALQSLRDHGRIEPGNEVLIIGASGGVGTFAVQLAKSFGATVTGVCSTRNLELVRSLGADHVVDYTVQDFADDERRYDLVMHLAGLRPLSEYRSVLRPKGTLVLVAGDSNGHRIGPVGRIVRATLLSPFVGHRLVSFTEKPSKADLLTLTALIESGEVTPVIDRTYPLAELPDAIDYLEEGHAVGKIVISTVTTAVTHPPICWCP